MKKLYFRYGAMTSAKSLNLIAVWKNYEVQGKKCITYRAFPHEKPESALSAFIDSRVVHIVPCRGIWSDSVDPFHDLIGKGYSCILIDECQFLSPEMVDYFRVISVYYRIPVICYGLRTDWKGNLFPGSRRLMEVADSIEEVKTTCRHCESKATMNQRVSGDGEEMIDLAKDHFIPACYKCWSISSCKN